MRTRNLLSIKLTARVALMALALAAAACGDKADPRFESARGAVMTLLRTHALDAMPEADVAAHMRSGGKLTMKSEEEFRACFADYKTAADEGLAGFVLGRLAPRKDSLLVEEKGDRAEVRIKNTAQKAPVAVLVRREGNWRFSLEESVPADLKQRLRELYQRTETMHRSQGGARKSP